MRIITLIAFLFALPSAGQASSARWAFEGDTLLTGAAATGQAGDIIMENEELRFILGGPGHGGYYAMSGGNVLDAGLRASGVDLLGEQYTFFNHDWPRQAVYTQIEIVDDGSSGSARVLASGEDSQNPNLLVSTEYILSSGATALELRTTMTQTGPNDLHNFELGDAFTWEGAVAFLPGYGEDPPSETEAPWLAASNGTGSIGYADQAANQVGEHGSGWSDLTLLTAELPVNTPVTYSRFLILREGGVGAAVADIHIIQGTPTGAISASFSLTPEAYPWLLSEIMLRDPEGLPYLSMTVPAEAVGAATLPVGDWSLSAWTPGYSADSETISLAVDDSLHFHFEQSYAGEVYTVGDTLTIIQRPLLNIPAIVTPGHLLEISCVADPATAEWTAEISHADKVIPLVIEDADYDETTLWWTVAARIPEQMDVYELYDLRVSADGEVDVSANAVSVIPTQRDDFYFIQITDTHLPTHAYCGETGQVPDSTEVADLRAVIADINLINPEFVLLTGDLVNEGELEDYLFGREFTRAQTLIAEFEVPVYLVAGNHDLGGWLWTPPPDGTARRDWWRFFGWGRLDAPPPGAPARTQDFAFTYGQVMFIGLEAYDNYDRWREDIYGRESFTDAQMLWLDGVLGASRSAAHVLFYHYDFQYEVDLASLGVDLALWGHIHRDEGNINVHPYDIATNNTCDGERAFRLIRAAGEYLSPRPTLWSGAYGEKLRAQFIPANNGQHESVTCQLTNLLNERFEHARVKFHLPHSAHGYDVEGAGEIAQVDSSGEHSIVYLSVDLQPGSQELLTVSVGEEVSVEPPPARLFLSQNHPNPFNPKTEINFGLPEAGLVRLSVYGVDGRRLARLVDNHWEAGEHHLSWDGRDDRGEALASGPYLLRLDTAEGSVSKKLLLIR